MSKVNKLYEREINQRESVCHNRNKKSKCEKCCFKSKQILFFYEREISQRESACQKTCALTPLPPSFFLGVRSVLLFYHHQHHPHHHHQHLLHHSQRQFAIIVIFWQSLFMLCLSIVITIISSIIMNSSFSWAWLLTSGWASLTTRWSPTSSCCFRQPRCCFFLFQSVIRSNSDSKDSCNSIIFRPGSLYSWRARPFNTFISSSITRWSLK